MLRDRVLGNIDPENVMTGESLLFTDSLVELNKTLVGRENCVSLYETHPNVQIRVIDALGGF